MDKKSKTLGIIGGLGPMSSVYFYELITKLTRASCDQEHIDIILSSRATTPDRTAYILGQSDENPADCMIADAKMLVRAGADIIAIPCNTAHYFYDAIKKEINVPLLNIIDETLDFLAAHGAKNVGILATEGTVFSGTYQLSAKRHGIVCTLPDNETQKEIMSIIYDDIKRGLPADMKKFSRAADTLFASGCDHLVLGCTELSLIKRENSLDERFVDSLDVLARATIAACGKEIAE